MERAKIWSGSHLTSARLRRGRLCRAGDRRLDMPPVELIEVVAGPRHSPGDSKEATKGKEGRSPRRGFRAEVTNLELQVQN